MGRRATGRTTDDAQISKYDPLLTLGHREGAAAAGLRPRSASSCGSRRASPPSTRAGDEQGAVEVGGATMSKTE